MDIPFGTSALRTFTRTIGTGIRLAYARALVLIKLGLRVIAVPVAVGLACALAVVAVHWIAGSLGVLPEHFDGRLAPSGVEAFGIGMVLATIRDAAGTLPLLWKFVTDPKGSLQPLLEACTAIFIAALGLAAALVFGRADTPAEPAFTILSASPAQSPIAAFAVSFQGEGSRNSLYDAEDEAVRVPDNAADSLRQIGKALASCARGGKLRVQIAGFASSTRWLEASHPCIDRNLAEGRTVSRSEAFNLCLADMRASAVLRELGLRDLEPSSVRLKRWSSYDEMREERVLIDDGDGTLQDARLPLGRIAEIRILAADGCKRERAPQVVPGGARLPVHGRTSASARAVEVMSDSSR